MEFINYMSTLEGRSLQNVVGALLIGGGIMIHKEVGYIIAVIGLLLILAVVFNVYLMSVFLSKKK